LFNIFRFILFIGFDRLVQKNRCFFYAGKFYFYDLNSQENSDFRVIKEACKINQKIKILPVKSNFTRLL